LTLLNPSVGLTAVTVEGIATEAVSSTADASAWEGVDCALYYGGASNQAADRIELIQQKYSSADPDKNWTIARLCSNSAKTTNNSVFRRLADAFTATLHEKRDEATLAVRLVSNQPVANEILTLIQLGRDPAARASATDKKFKANFAAAKIATGLNDHDLSSFLDVFDVSECGSQSRFSLRDSVTAIVAQSVGEDANSNVRELQTRIRELMLPESIRQVITSKIVLGWFGIANATGLFPAPSEFKEIKDPILREPARAALDALNNGSNVVCLVGPAGCGKTTTLRQLGKLLSPTSIFVAFDCYGAGRYIYSNDGRHLPEHAFTQIINELNLVLGAPYILSRGSRNPVDIKRFMERLASLSAVLDKLDKNALLVIGIDAADNAVTAALRPSVPERCFVHDLAHADPTAFPKNVRLIFSTRPGRKSSLQLATDTKEVICPAFSADETTKFVHRTIPEATATWIQQFHALSHGIPRVQDYAMRAGGGDPNKTLNALRPGGKDLNEVLRQLFKTASDKIGTTSLYETLTASLAALPAPIPPALLAAVSGIAEADLLGFVDDVLPGLRSDADGVAIADEDVEDFIRSEGAPGLAEAQVRACDQFSRIYLTNEYAAIHYADMLAETGRAIEILGIIEKDLAPAAISDPIIRREVQLRRLRFAMRACREAGTPVDSAKVMLLAAEASKDEAALTEILETETDLSIRFARSSLMRLVLSDSDSAAHQGDVLAHDAARAARSGDLIQAREQLHFHDVWLERRRNVPEDKQGDWAVDDDQLTARIEAIALVAGAQSAIRNLSRWRPRSLFLRIGLELTYRLISRGNSSLLVDAVRQNLVPAEFEFVLLVPLLLSGAHADLNRLETSLAKIRRRLLPNWQSLIYATEERNWPGKILDLVVTGCEIAYANGLAPAAIKHALSCIADFDTPLTIERSRLDATALDILLRGWLLWQSIAGNQTTIDKATDFISPKPPTPPASEPKKKGRKPKKSKVARSRERDDETRKYLRAIYPVYESRRHILAHRAAGGLIDDEQLTWLSSFDGTEYLFERNYETHAYRAATAQSVMTLMHLPLTLDRLLVKATDLLSTKWTDPFATRVKSLWEMALLRSSAHAFLLGEVTKKWEQIKLERATASDKVSALISLSRLVLNFSEHDAKALFEDAVAKAQEIDREAIDQIEFTSALTRDCASWPVNARKEDAGLLFRFVTDVAIRLANDDGFPWDDSIEALARLSPSIALTAVSRWSDEGLRVLHLSLSTAVDELVKQQVMSGELAIALLPLLFRSDPDLLDRILSMLNPADIARRSPIFEALQRDWELNLPPGDQEAVGSVIVKHAERLGSTDDVKRVDEARAFLEKHRPKIESKADEEPKLRTTESLPDLSGHIFLTALAVRKGLEAIREKVEYFSTAAALEKMRAVIKNPNDYVSFLNAVSYSDLGPYSDPDRARAILDALNAWGDTPALQRWRQIELPKVIVDTFGGITRWLKQGSSPLQALLDATTLSPQRIGEVLIEGAQKTGLAMGSRSLFGVAEHLANTLTPDQARELHHWYVRRLDSRVSPESLTLDIDDVSDSFDEAVGRFMYAQLSDVDTRIRWKAAHSLRRMARMGVVGALNATFSNLDRTQDKSFRNDTAPYYWMSAKLWALIAIARIAAEHPELVASLLPLLLNIAADKEFPHFLIREHAKIAVLTLAKTGHATDAQRDAVAGVNVSPFPRIIERKNRQTHISWEEPRKKGVHLDMDILEKWYQPVLKLFPLLTRDQFLNEVAYWLVAQWQMTETTSYWNKEPRKGRLPERQYMLWSSMRGHLPIIERYGLYLEWHGIFCAVGRLLAKYPLRKSKPHDYDSFEEWLKDKAFESPPFWASDKRTAKPLWPSLWFQPLQDEKHWLSRAAKDQFLSVIQPSGNGPDVFINVFGDWDAGFPTRETSVHLTSALITPEKATALAASLRDYDRPWGFSFPHHDEDHEIKSGPYKLSGWVNEKHGDDRIDDRDPLRYGATRNSLVPSALLKTLKPDGFHNWVDKNGHIAARNIVWSDLPEHLEDERYRQRETKSQGHCLQVRSDVLSSLLNATGSDLIIGVNLERKVMKEYRSPHETDSQKRKSFCRIFIFRRSGKIEDFRSVVGTWRRHHK
jgi:energy-coupling factor transporter ATP-binding protein EcfA2